VIAASAAIVRDDNEAAAGGSFRGPQTMFCLWRRGSDLLQL
jgi:hypothetical protein